MNSREIISDVLDSYDVESYQFIPNITSDMSLLQTALLSSKNINVHIKNTDIDCITSLNEFINKHISKHYNPDIMPGHRIPKDPSDFILVVNSPKTHNVFNITQMDNSIGKEISDEIHNMKFIKRIKFLTNLNLVQMSINRYDKEDPYKCSNINLEFTQWCVRT